MDQVVILTAAPGFLVLGLVRHRIQGTVLTGLTLFAAVGLLVGPAVLGLLPLKVNNAALPSLSR